jgi:RNA polymerase sigma factor (sigma-70 family)
MRRTRPERNELFRAAIELVSTGSSGFKSTARRYSLCPADAEDAYQRGLEILITKAPTGERTELKPWLHTVIKHEALAIRRQRERMLEGQPSPLESGTHEGQNPEERAPERERAQRTAEALSQLKPSEVQCLLLKAVGYSYDEISTKTGFSWTKVNRSLTEGRKRFFDRFAQIESGQRCGRFRSLLSVASDGEATPDDERLLKTHLRACSSCRAALRDYRALPARLAELIPPAVLLPALQKESWWSRLHDSLALWTADRGGAIGHKLQQVGDALSAQKATAVVASTAALTGGAVVHERASSERGSHKQQHIGRSADPSAAARATAALPNSSPSPTTPPASSQPADESTESGTHDPGATAGEFTPERASPQSANTDPEGPASGSPDPTSPASQPVGMPDPADSGSRAASARKTDSGPAGAGQEFGP